MKLNQIKTHCINANSPANLDTAVDTWLRTSTLSEATFMSLDYNEYAGNYSVLIVYTL